MPRVNRNILKGFFKKGSMPTESSFNDLIDSSVNILDDGFLKNIDEGYMIAPSGKSQKLISFYDNAEFKNPAWSLNLDNDKAESSFDIKNRNGSACLHIDQSGNTGINTDKPRVGLHVNSSLAAIGRIGTFKAGQADADGRWQDLITGLNGCHAFEIVARVGKKDHGKYALLHAIALSTYGRSRSRIRKTQAHYGWFWNQLKLRWYGDTFSYGLQVKTRTDYGAGIKISYHIMQLWGDDEMENFFKEEKTP